MERLLYWTMFVIAMVLAAWLPMTSAFPQLEARLVHFIAVTRL